ncbi:MAG: hypothetical protein HOO96_09180 [Polyangiaceae bacterium]|nr:hypothetical protein [Polyangiaceae bacterium]
MDTDSESDLTALWDEDVAPWRAIVPDACSVVRGDEEWFASDGKHTRRRAADFAKLRGGPTLEELRDRAAETAKGLGWQVLDYDEEFGRSVFQVGPACVRVWIATEIRLMTAGLSQQLRVDVFEPSSAAPPFSPSRPAQTLLHGRLGLGMPLRMRRECFFGLNSLLAEDLVETFELPAPAGTGALDGVLGPAADGTWSATFPAPGDTSIAVEAMCAGSILRATITSLHPL